MAAHVVEALTLAVVWPTHGCWTHLTVNQHMEATPVFSSLNQSGKQLVHFN